MIPDGPIGSMSTIGGRPCAGPPSANGTQLVGQKPLLGTRFPALVPCRARLFDTENTERPEGALVDQESPGGAIEVIPVA